MAKRVRRIGTFTVSKALIINCIEGEGANLFDRMVVMEVTHDFARDTSTYLAIHPDFDEVKEGLDAPEYVATTFDENGSPTWERVGGVAP